MDKTLCQNRQSSIVDLFMPLNLKKATTASIVIQERKQEKNTVHEYQQPVFISQEDLSVFVDGPGWKLITMKRQGNPAISHFNPPLLCR